VHSEWLNRRRPINIAHRGARAFAPENTLEAFEKAAACAAEAVELDVQLAADRQLVVIHDETLDRCSDVRERFPGRGDYAVKAFTLGEVQSLDAGSWFVRVLETEAGRRPSFLRLLGDAELGRFLSDLDRQRYRSGRVRHPSLREALVRCAELGLLVNVELKTSPPHGDALVRQVVGLIDALGQRDRVLISSFDQDALRSAKQRGPTIATGVLVEQPLADPVHFCRQLGVDAFHPPCYGEHDLLGFESAEYLQTGHLPAEPIQSLQRAGIAVNAWTENDPARMRRLISADVSGIFTDYPNRLAELLQRVDG
jgi:glycerophosphoryl diester phosphodiesterase